MRRGFKTEASALAREVRAELSLSRTGAPRRMAAGRTSRNPCDSTVQFP